MPKLGPFDKLKPGEQTFVLVSLKVFTLYKILIAKAAFEINGCPIVRRHVKFVRDNKKLPPELSDGQVNFESENFQNKSKFKP